MPINRSRIHFDNVYADMNKSVGPFSIYQIGDLTCEPGYVVNKHIQRVHEISLIVSGEGEFITDEKKQKVRKGMIYVNRVGESHEIRSSSINPLRFFYIGFLISQSIDETDESVKLMQKFFRKPGTSRVEHIYNLQEYFINLFTELLIEDILSDMLIETYILQIIGITYRLFSQNKYVICRTDEHFDSDKKLVYDVMHHIDTEMESIERLGDLSKEFGYSYSSISQKFLEHVGENLKTYYNQKRFEKAKSYLYKGYSITDTAALINFKSIHSFSRAFHMNTGMSPSEFKRWAEQNKTNNSNL